MAETDGNGNLTALYVRNRDQLLAVMRPGSTPGTWTTRFVHGDGLGSVRALTDETGTTIDSRGYEAFGTKNVEAGSDPLAYGFAGEPFEPTSVLAYHRARWMDARVGRFEGMDPVDGDDQQPITWHRYLYANNNPANLIDPSGRTALQGIYIHGVIGSDFVAYGDYARSGTTPPSTVITDVQDPLYGSPCRVTNRTISTILGVLGLSRARPDLYDRCTEEVWEIKQWDDEDEALSDVFFYISTLEAMGEDAVPGVSYDPPHLIPLPGNNSAAVWAPDPGVILYEISSSNFTSPATSPFPALSPGFNPVDAIGDLATVSAGL